MSDLIPFDLERAKAGDPVITRRGEEATVVYIDPALDDTEYPVVCIVHKPSGKYKSKITTFTRYGEQFRDTKSDYDLFMKEPVKVVPKIVTELQEFIDKRNGYYSTELAKILLKHLESQS